MEDVSSWLKWGVSLHEDPQQKNKKTDPTKSAEREVSSVKAFFSNLAQTIAATINEEEKILLFERQKTEEEARKMNLEDLEKGALEDSYSTPSSSFSSFSSTCSASPTSLHSSTGSPKLSGKPMLGDVWNQVVNGINSVLLEDVHSGHDYDADGNLTTQNHPLHDTKKQIDPHCSLINPYSTLLFALLDNEVTKEEVKRICKKKETFLGDLNKAHEDSETFDDKLASIAAEKALENLPILAEMRFRLVPKYVSEKQFWRQFFGRLSTISVATSESWNRSDSDSAVFISLPPTPPSEMKSNSSLDDKETSESGKRNGREKRRKEEKQTEPQVNEIQTEENKAESEEQQEREKDQEREWIMQKNHEIELSKREREIEREREKYELEREKKIVAERELAIVEKESKEVKEKEILVTKMKNEQEETANFEQSKKANWTFLPTSALKEDYWSTNTNHILLRRNSSTGILSVGNWDELLATEA